MKTYEYIRLRFDWGDLRELNSLSSDGWRVVQVVNNPSGNEHEGDEIALMERGKD